MSFKKPESRLKVGVFTGTRAEYGLLHPVISAMSKSNDFEPLLYVSGSHLDARFGNTLEEIEKDGFSIAKKIPMHELGNNMAAECGLLTQMFGQYLSNPSNRPDCLLILGDRYESLGVGTAAFLNNIPLGHIHGGDVVRGGMLDDPIRHALTKLSHLHFPATQASAQRILSLGEEPWRVTVVGSPALDNIRQIPKLEKDFFTKQYSLDPEKPWVLVTQHPITTEAEQAGKQARQVLSAIASLGEDIQVIATYPNHDEGATAIIRELEQAATALPQFRLVQSLGRIQYLNILRYVSAVVGNSSSGLLETAFFNVPCLNVGDRQKGRERGENVLDVTQDETRLTESLQSVLFDPETRQKLQSGRHPFGTGRCAERILQVLAETPFNHSLLQKQLTY